MKILHVTECLSAGVLDVILRLAKQQSASGHEVHVLHAPRTNTPADEEISAAFGDDANVRRAGSTDQPLRTRLMNLRTDLRRMTTRSFFDVIHLHSTYAGLVGRTLGLQNVVYTPHAFAFLRQDKSGLVQTAIYATELILARRCVGLIAVSNSEAAAAKRLRFKSVRVLPNVLDLKSTPLLVAGSHGQRVRVVNAGRWAYQKGTDRFERAASSLKDDADFMWIGADPMGNIPQVADVTVTGWLQPAMAMQMMAAADLMYFTSRWEGMPVSLMQAQAIGLPVVAIDCPGVEDVVIDGETGYIVSDEAEGLERLRALVRDTTLRQQISQRAREARHRFDDEGYGDRAVATYRSLIASV